MKTCQQCHEREAIVHLTLAGNGNSVTLHLCNECAAARGLKSGLIDWAAGNSFSGDMSDLLPEWLAGEMESVLQCEQCGATLAEYRVSQRLGCDRCWTTFESTLTGLVRRIHGSRIHRGPVYLNPDQDHDPGLLLESHRVRIRAELADAVCREAFEDAAVLRDALRELGESE